MTDSTPLNEAQTARVAALMSAQAVLSDRPSVFGGTENKRPTDDLIDVSEYILHGAVATITPRFEFVQFGPVVPCDPDCDHDVVDERGPAQPDPAVDRQTRRAARAAGRGKA